MSSDRTPQDMSTVAFTPQDSRSFTGLRYTAMAKSGGKGSKGAKGSKVYGPRVIAYVIPRYFENLTAFQVASTYAYSTVQDWKHGKADPRLEELDSIAALLKEVHKVDVDPLDLLRKPVEDPDAPPDRYTARAEAARWVRGQVSDAAINDVLSAEYNPEDVETWKPIDWASEIHRVEKALRLRRDKPTQAAAEDRRGSDELLDAAARLQEQANERKRQLAADDQARTPKKRGTA